jgi:hypothetical protein
MIDVMRKRWLVAKGCMKGLTMFVFLTILSANGGVAWAQVVSSSEFSLIVSAPKTTVQVGEDLKIEITMTNTSDHDLFYDASDHETSFGLEVRDSGGRIAPRTPLGRRVGAYAGSIFASRLHPGESIHREWMAANKYFELGDTGKYSVQAIRMASKTTALKSNIVTIAIVQ